MNLSADRRWIWPALLLLVTDAEGTLPSINQIDRALSIGAYTPRQAKPTQGFSLTEFGAFIESFNNSSTDVQQSSTNVGLEVEVEIDNLSPPPDGGEERVVFAPRPSGWTKRLEATFEEFWKAYPRKVAKGDARRVWARLRPATYLEAIHETLKLQCRSEQWRRESGRFIPYPATWLNAAGWESTGIDKARLNGEGDAKELTSADLETAFDA